MKTFAAITVLLLSGLAHADPDQVFKCSSSNGGVELTVSIFYRAQSALIDMEMNGEKQILSAKLSTFSGSNMGHSRCPGTWGGLKFTPIFGSTGFKDLSIITDEHFFECGFAPSSELKALVNGKEEFIPMFCKKDIHGALASDITEKLASHP